MDPDVRCTHPRDLPTPPDDMTAEFSKAQDLLGEISAKIGALDALLIETRAQMRGLMATMSGLDHELLMLYRRSRNRHVHVAQRISAYGRFVLANLVLTAVPRSRYHLRPRRSSARPALTHAFRVHAVLAAMRARCTWRAQFWRMPLPNAASPH